MAAWASKGHGMRRRDGDPSNHLESVGNSMARSHATHEEAYEAAASVGSARIPFSAAKATAGTPVAKGNTQAADPTAGGKANRANVSYNERLGAQYKVTVPYTPTIDPAAGPTMANARIIPSVAGRVNPNFQGGVQASNA
jgi:hypothetical protein